MPDIATTATAGQIVGDGSLGVAGGGVFVLVKELITRLVFRNGKESATKEFVGKKIDETKALAKADIKEALVEYPNEDKVKLMLQAQFIGCSNGFQAIKDGIIGALREEMRENRKEAREEFATMWKRIEELSDKK